MGKWDSWKFIARETLFFYLPLKFNSFSFFLFFLQKYEAKDIPFPLYITLRRNNPPNRPVNNGKAQRGVPA